MKKRLLSLLLVVVMVLSTTAFAFDAPAAEHMDTEPAAEQYPAETEAEIAEEEPTVAEFTEMGELTGIAPANAAEEEPLEGDGEDVPPDVPGGSVTVMLYIKGEVDKLTDIAYEDGSTPETSGDAIVLNGASGWIDLTVRLEEGYTLIAGEGDSCWYSSQELHILDWDGDGIVTITVAKGIVVHIDGATEALGEEGVQDGAFIAPDHLSLLIKAGYYMAILRGAELEEEWYTVHDDGQVYRIYQLVPTGDGDVYITIDSDPNPTPRAVPVTINCDVGEYDDIVYYAPPYALTGHQVGIDINPQYELEAVEGCWIDGDIIYVFEDATEVILNVVEASGLTLVFNDPTGEAHLYDEDGNELKDGDSVYLGSTLTGTAPAGCTFSSRAEVRQLEDGTFEIYISSWFGGDTVTISVIKGVVVHLSGETDALAEGMENPKDGEVVISPFGGIPLYLKPGYMATATGAELNYEEYQQNWNGEIYRYYVFIATDDDVYITLAVDPAGAPTTVPVTVICDVGEYDDIVYYAPKTALAGGYISIDLNPRYTIEAVAGCRVDRGEVFVLEDATEVVVRVIPITPFKLVLNDPTGEAHIYEDGQELKPGDDIYPGGWLRGTAPDGYTFAGDVYAYEREKGIFELDIDRELTGDTITINVVKRLYIHLTGAVEALRSGLDGPELEREMRYSDGAYRSAVLLQDPTYEAVVLENGHVGSNYYYLSGDTGEIALREIGIIGDGSGDVTVEIRKSDEPLPTVIAVEFIDDDNAIQSASEHTLPGQRMYVGVRSGYTVTVQGGKISDVVEYREFVEYTILVDDDAERVIVTVAKVGDNDGDKDEHVHNADKVTTVEPTCGKAGSKTYACSICGEVQKTETISATGNHKWNDGEVTKAATTKEKGVLTYTCTVCSSTRTEEIPVIASQTEVKGDSDATADKETVNNAVDSVVDSIAKGNTTAGVDKKVVEAIQEAVEAGEEVSVSTVVTVNEVENPAGAEAIESKVSGTVELYLDISIDIVVTVTDENGNETTTTGAITEIAEPITFTVPLPEGLEGAIIYVVRLHDGVVEKLPTTVSNGVVTFSSDKFSEFAIVSSNDIADAVVTLEKSEYTYTGEAIEPAVTVTVMTADGKVTLTEGVDYTVAYKNNINAGTATVVITGMGVFEGSSTEVTFQIKAPSDSGNSSDTGSSTQKSAPKTGDEGSIALWLAMFALCTAGAAVTAGRKKKTEK